MLNSKS